MFSGNYQTYQNNYANTPQTARNTNIVFVTSAEEAVMRTPNDADMVYIHQSKPVMYRVIADMWGRKSVAEYPYIVPTPENSAPVTRAEFDSLVAKVTALTKEAPNDDKPVQ